MLNANHFIAISGTKIVIKLYKPMINNIVKAFTDNFSHFYFPILEWRRHPKSYLKDHRSYLFNILLPISTMVSIMVKIIIKTQPGTNNTQYKDFLIIISYLHSKRKVILTR